VGAPMYGEEVQWLSFARGTSEGEQDGGYAFNEFDFSS